ncbi:hypothetical protein ACLOJK_000970 [Asimina triloba]
MVTDDFNVSTVGSRTHHARTQRFDSIPDEELQLQTKSRERRGCGREREEARHEEAKAMTKNQDPDVQIIHCVKEEEDDVLTLFDFDDDVVLLSCSGEDKNRPISVENYFDTVRLQTSLYNYDSLSGSKQRAIHVPDDDDDDEVESVQVVNTARSYRFWRNPQPLSGHSITEKGESSSSKAPRPAPLTVCKICMEPKLAAEIFTVNECKHVFCSECIGQHVAAKIQENAPAVRCPEPSCQGVLEPVFCQSILPPEVFDRWGSVLCENLILGSMKFYCPFNDCSALLVDERGQNEGAIMESECPHCRRLFCATCKVPWHSGSSCENFQKLGEHERNREDIMLMNLAKSKKWQRCPQCGFYVEKTDGCLFMRCSLICILGFCSSLRLLAIFPVMFVLFCVCLLSVYLNFCRDVDGDHIACCDNFSCVERYRQKRQECRNSQCNKLERESVFF